MKICRYTDLDTLISYNSIPSKSGFIQAKGKIKFPIYSENIFFKRLIYLTRYKQNPNLQVSVITLQYAVLIFNRNSLSSRQKENDAKNSPISFACVLRRATYWISGLSLQRMQDG